MEMVAELGEDFDINRKVYLPLLNDTDECRCRSSASLNGTKILVEWVGWSTNIRILRMRFVHVQLVGLEP